MEKYMQDIIRKRNKRNNLDKNSRESFDIIEETKRLKQKLTR